MYLILKKKKEGTIEKTKVGDSNDDLVGSKLYTGNRCVSSRSEWRPVRK